MIDLETLYERKRATKRAMSHHMPALRNLASNSNRCVEFGVRTGGSTVALLLGCTGKVHSFDVEKLPEHDEIARVAGNQWEIQYVPSEQAPVIECDLLFIDSFHNYSQVKLELDRHADAVRKYIAFHDSISCAVVGQGITGNRMAEHYSDTRGIRLAIDELMIRDPSWRIHSHDPLSSGMLVLRRQP